MDRSSLSLKRLLKEAGETKATVIRGISININHDDFYKWEATLDGPQDTPYAGGKFRFEIKFSLDYPLVPPKVRCLTRIFHCNINSQGDICLDIIKEKWTPLLTIQSVLLSVQQLLCEPNPDDPLMHSVAAIYKTNLADHNKRAKLFTLRFAKE